jgi:hypothetical protein
MKEITAIDELSMAMESCFNKLDFAYAIKDMDVSTESSKILFEGIKPQFEDIIGDVTLEGIGSTIIEFINKLWEGIKSLGRKIKELAIRFWKWITFQTDKNEQKLEEAEEKIATDKIKADVEVKINDAVKLSEKLTESVKARDKTLDATEVVLEKLARQDSDDWDNAYDELKAEWDKAAPAKDEKKNTEEKTTKVDVKQAAKNANAAIKNVKVATIHAKALDKLDKKRDKALSEIERRAKQAKTAEEEAEVRKAAAMVSKVNTVLNEINKANLKDIKAVTDAVTEEVKGIAEATINALSISGPVPVVLGNVTDTKGAAIAVGHILAKDGKNFYVVHPDGVCNATETKRYPNALYSTQSYPWHMWDKYHPPIAAITFSVAREYAAKSHYEAKVIRTDEGIEEVLNDFPKLKI